MAEVEILSIVSRSEELLLARIISKKWKQYLKIIQEQGNLEVPYISKWEIYNEGTIVSIRFSNNDRIEIVSVFGNENDIDLDERLILWLSHARTDFGSWVVQESEKIKQTNTPKLQYKNTPARTDFRNWYTLTIDGSDAKDLDDAISIREEKNGDYTLAVHIADVAEYVIEGSAIDREAVMRSTSIYTPGKVIPMLPEILSNDLCSLQAGTMKLTLSCVMTIDAKGYVKHTDIVEGIIESRHRGVYDDIYKIMENNPLEKRWNEWAQRGLGEETVWVRRKKRLDERSVPSFSDPNSFGTFDSKSTENSIWLYESISLAKKLFHILEKRRRKEWKITFESTEIYFDFGDKNTKNNVIKTPLGIKKRERNDAHKLIEEFMVLANEEVAKWCENNGLPFLSRVHWLPGNEQTEIIQEILRKNGDQSKSVPLFKRQIPVLEPTHIREFLEKIQNPIDLYRFSRLLLPKMAKATYSDTPFRHFGLALEYYAHFTSPIRRYPDLQVHRIIKEKIHGVLTPERIAHYKTILKKIARKCSEQERSAEDIERAMNSLYICRYMRDKIGKTYRGQISGLAEFALFVELENGIETTLYLPRGRYNIDQIEGILTTTSGKKLWSIGEMVQVRIESVNMTERRVVVENVV